MWTKNRIKSRKNSVDVLKELLINVCFRTGKVLLLEYIQDDVNKNKILPPKHTNIIHCLNKITTENKDTILLISLVTKLTPLTNCQHQYCILIFKSS